MSIKDYLDKQVGFIQVNKPIVYTDKNYETACWWEERASDLGVYPLVLTKVDQYSSDFTVRAKVSGTITNDYFPALWAGSPISNEPYKAKYVGQESRPIIVQADLTQAIVDTAMSPGNAIDWYINLKFWKMFINNREEELLKAYNDLPKWWMAYQAGEDQFNSRVGMVGYAAGKIAQFTKEIGELYRKVGYLEEESDMWRKYHEVNTAWISKAA